MTSKNNKESINSPYFILILDDSNKQSNNQDNYSKTNANQHGRQHRKPTPIDDAAQFEHDERDGQESKETGTVVAVLFHSECLSGLKCFPSLDGFIITY